MGNTQSCDYTEISNNNVDIEIYNDSNFTTNYLFHTKSKSSIQYKLAPLSNIVINVTFLPTDMYIEWVSDSCENDFGIISAWNAKLKPEENKIIFINPKFSRTTSIRLDKTSSPWILHSHYINRRKLKLINRSSQIISIIGFNRTYNVSPESSFELSPFMDIATHLGTKLKIKRPALKGVDTLVAQKIYYRDGLIFTCKDSDRIDKHSACKVKVIVEDHIKQD